MHIDIISCHHLLSSFPFLCCDDTSSSPSPRSSQLSFPSSSSTSVRLSVHLVLDYVLYVLLSFFIYLSI
eukprot:m.178207 g.178207  ORF g.178207 m.178207 type:complete len:69 (-) comp16587_c0_seq2:96-302(-)